MGHVILPTGATLWVEELSGSVNLSHLINDMQCDDYTASYRMSIIAALGKLGKSAESALVPLKNFRLGTKESVLQEAAEQAIKKISEGKEVKKQHWNEHYNKHTDGMTGMSVVKKPEVNKVTIEEIQDGPLYEGTKHYRKCKFCEKITLSIDHHKRFSDLLCGDDFYCGFCIRNDYYHKFNKNVMVLTYRGVIGYYYYAYFVTPKTSSMYLNDLSEYINFHEKAGMQNPLFRYDRETYCWFIDFSKVGSRKVPVESVLATIVEQLACFNIYENVREASPAKLYQKYKDAVMEFYNSRERINGDKVFSPTLWGCGIPTVCPAGVRPIPVDVLQNFSPASLIDRVTSTRRGI